MSTNALQATISEAIPLVSPSLPRRILRRDGSDVPFEVERIASALARAGAASGEFDVDEAQLRTARVL